jgi:kynurenine formamidase
MGTPPPLRAADVDGYRASLSNWGRWGEADELGCLNHLQPAHTAAAAALVRSGRTVSCARPLPTEPGPDNPRPVEHHMIGTGTEGYGADWFGIASHGHATSHVDALCHIFWDGALYGGRSTDVVTAHGATELGVETLRDGVVGRGVLLDVPAALGLDALEPGTPITVEDLEACEAHAGVRVATGDLLLVRTGRWGWRHAHGPWPVHDRLAGLHASCLPWLHDREVAVLGSDGVSDVYPSHIDGVHLPIHTVAIVAMGLHLLDNLDLEALSVACAEEGRAEVLLAVAPLVLRGGTASPVNPIAIF